MVAGNVEAASDPIGAEGDVGEGVAVNSQFLDGMTTETVGEARYNLGDKVMVQLENIQGEYHSLGLSFGKWNVMRENDGSSTIVRSLFDLNMVGLNETPVTVMPLSRMREIVRQISN